MKKSTLLIFCFFLFSCDFKSAVDYFDEARKLEDAEMYQEANLLLDRAIKKWPDYRPAIYNRAVNKSALGYYREAINDYYQILKFNPRNARVILNIGNNYKRLNQFEKSLIAYEKLIKERMLNDSDTLVIYYGNRYLDDDSFYLVSDLELKYELAITYLRLDKVMEAKELFEYLITENYLAFSSKSFLGECYLKLKKTKKACELFLESAKNNVIESKALYKQFCYKE
tara:strand:- start:39648 stop:40328 length:681 start_codon:yes stop_codon:yes gene_type:complete